MPGTKAGAQKARDKLLADDPEHFKKMGKKSWADPERSRVTGFALLTPEERSAFGTKGGKKTKNEYRKMEKVDKATATSKPEVPLLQD